MSRRSAVATTTTTTTAWKCFNIFILSGAFMLPIYVSSGFSVPSSFSDHHHQGKDSRAHAMSFSQRPLPIFILDFDATITTIDTVSALFASAIRWHERVRGEAGGDEMRGKLDGILTAYESDWTSHHDDYHREEGRRGGGGEGEEMRDRVFESSKSIEQLVDHQRSLKEVEERSFDRVSASGILGRIGTETWWDLGREAVLDSEDGKSESGVVIRGGWEAFRKRIHGRWGVVSVNFCGDWVRGILNLDRENGLEGVQVMANEPNARGEFEGDLMVSCDGKREAMRVLINRLRRDLGVEGDERVRVVYIGDSATDIECLLDEGVIGVVMTREDGGSKLLDVLRGLEGFEVRSMGEYDFVNDGDTDREGKGRAVVYYANDFREIERSPLFRG